MFVLEDGFFLLGHRIVKLGIISSRTALCSSWMHICVFVRRFGVTARIQINAFDFFILLTFLDGRKVFRVGAEVVSSVFCPDDFPCVLADRYTEVIKSSLLPRIQVSPRGRTALVLAVRFSTCLVRELMTLSCSADFFLKFENIFLTFSNAAVFASALTTVTFAAGVLSMLSSAAVPSRVCWLLISSADIFDRALVDES
ncbi:hypothetical protein F2Q69_00006004 [Brassica cretica]|uniref:Uncharacterized protein n=1 Tax=Brassica cretica TaxID=69181 RepID=A0A8S9PAY8_BRACR|nr:hypothetical protein F2Q69_00006004 [Brassica cretica]